MEYWSLEQQDLIDEIQNTINQEDELCFWYMGQDGFAFKYRNKLVLIDPVFGPVMDQGIDLRLYPAPFAPNALKADYVLCTHGHIDHMVKDTLLGLVEANPALKVIIPIGCKELALSFGLQEHQLITGKDRQVLEISDDIAALFSVHCISLAHPGHVYEENDPDMALGYEIHFGKNKVIHLGDTYLTETLLTHLRELDTPDILMMPINGDDLFRRMAGCIGNMEAEEAAKLAADLTPELAIPMHYDMVQNNTADPQRFVNKLRELDRDVTPLVPILGERFLYE